MYLEFDDHEILTWQMDWTLRNVYVIKYRYEQKGEENNLKGREKVKGRRDRNENRIEDRRKYCR